MQIQPPLHTNYPDTDYGEAYVRTLLGETDRAIDIIARYVKAYPSTRRQVRNTPWFAGLRGDDRFMALTSLQ